MMQRVDAGLIPQRYYAHLAAAFVRGHRPDLGRESDSDTVAAALDAGVRIHRFKRLDALPRVRRVVGLLKSFAPSSLLDIGSGRGAFLWPLLDALPELGVTSVDLAPERVAQIDAVRRGGVGRLTAVRGDVARLGFADGRFDAVTILEVLEHVEEPHAAAREVLRVARRAVIASVPSHADDNPGHVRLFDRAGLDALFRDVGAARVEIEAVLNHFIAVVKP